MEDPEGTWPGQPMWLEPSLKDSVDGLMPWGFRLPATDASWASAAPQFSPASSWSILELCPSKMDRWIPSNNKFVFPFQAAADGIPETTLCHGWMEEKWKQGMWACV